MEKNLILTGWGTSEYVAAAAVALKGLGGRADVRGVSRRRLPEFMAEAAKDWKRVYILGVSLWGDRDALVAALKVLKAKGVKATWISAFAMDEDSRAAFAGLLETHEREGWLLEAVGEYFGVDASPYLVYADPPKKVTGEVGEYFTLIDAAQYAYRNYQDESLYATVARYLASGIRSEVWAPEVKSAVRHFERYGNRELIGSSRVMLELQSRINRVAPKSARVLILGESGTGKETVANFIHNKSERRDQPFVAFNCGAVSKELLQDRFFGHLKGSFTSAGENTKGLFEQADGGTLFLDEVGEMTPETQAALLRVLEGGRFQKVGSSEEIKVDVRLITATNRNLPVMVREGKFREDLFQRINVVQLRVPSLREHKEDIPAIANAWWRKNHGGHTLGAEQLEALATYDYPGNVRELINLLDRATALEEYDFAKLLAEHREMNAGLVDPSVMAAGPVPDDLEEATRMHIRRVYDKYGQNLTKAAEALNVSRNTVRKYLDSIGN